MASFSTAPGSPRAKASVGPETLSCASLTRASVCFSVSEKLTLDDSIFGAASWPGSSTLTIWRTWRICASTESMDAPEETDEIAMTVPVVQPFNGCAMSRRHTHDFLVGGYQLVAYLHTHLEIDAGFLQV